MQQLQIDFSKSPNGYQLKSLCDYLKAGNEVTCNEHYKFDIAASALPRRIKDLRDIYFVPIKTEKKSVTRKDGKVVWISVYKINFAL